MTYDYKSGKQRIEEILNNHLDIEEVRTVPCENDFTFDNAYKAWISAIFVDIRDSTELFSNDDKEKVSKIVRCFTSEIIDILNDYQVDSDPQDYLEPEEIGIRGDCVYAIYSTPQKIHTYEIVNRAFFINTLLKMINKILDYYGYGNISAGIGISTAQEIIIKAGRKYSGINSKVWIGDAVTKASKLSGLGAKNGLNNIVMASCTHYNIIEQLKNISGESSASWFEEKYSNELGTYYHCNIIKTDFNNWVDEGMPS